MFTPDKPIEHLSDDGLGRASFARQLGHAITSYKNKDSFVIGLYGEWGSGKTSVINMVLDSMDLAQDKPIIVKFNPWNYSDQNQLTYQFFKQLAYEIGIADYEKHYKKVIKSLDIIAKAVVPFAAVHASGIAIKDIINSAKETVKKIADTHKNNLELLKKEINTVLGKFDKKILIVIDDIDRLNKQEIRQIFQLVKSLADFQNTIYLLSLDKNVVAEALNDIFNDGCSYLEKIIQVPFELPPASQEEVASFLFKRLDEILPTDEKQWDNTHWGNIYHSGIKYYFKTVRDVVRYANVLSFSYNLVKSEVNPVDFVAITALQVFDTQIHTAIIEHKTAFLQGQDKNAPILEAIYNQSIIGKDKIEALLVYLFPKANTRMGYSNDFYTIWRKALRVCSPELFEIYFRLSLAAEQLSKIDIDNTLSATENAKSFSDALMPIHEKGKIGVLLDRFMDYHEEIEQKNIENIFYALLDIGDLFLSKHKALYYDTNQTKISRLLFHLAKKLDADSYYKILSKSIEHSTNGAYVCLYTVFRTVEAEEESKKDPHNYENYPLLDNTQKDELKLLISTRLKDMCENKQLSKNEELYLVFVWWLKISDELLVRHCADILLSDDNALLQFIYTAVSIGSSQSSNDLVSRETLKFNCQNISKLIDIEVAQQRIQNILDAQNTLADRDKKILNIFIKWDGVYRENEW